ncbi:hypothetical protein TNCT_175301 [Trichonephila clavata]|uniref:Uncharacterized protein n=1 Tax=Trichonephila clavata TaxID=2740835 RepID=A0A8X6KDV6_TRICU|nr:hypothetical protein TNCT_175301 [Trichonephila clavata]
MNDKDLWSNPLSLRMMYHRRIEIALNHRDTRYLFLAQQRCPLAISLDFMLTFINLVFCAVRRTDCWTIDKFQRLAHVVSSVGDTEYGKAVGKSSSFIYVTETDLCSV